jgi:hypothetical protein
MEDRRTISLQEIPPSLGFSAETWLMTIGDPESAEFTWGDEASTTIEIGVGDPEAQPTFVDSRANPQLGGTFACLDYLEVPARLSLVTDDGGLDETLSVRLWTHEVDAAQWSATAAQSTSVRPRQLAPEPMEQVDLLISGAIEGGTTSGFIDGEGRNAAGEPVFFSVGQWGEPESE